MARRLPRRQRLFRFRYNQPAQNNQICRVPKHMPSIIARNKCAGLWAKVKPRNGTAGIGISIRRAIALKMVLHHQPVGTGRQGRRLNIHFIKINFPPISRLNQLIIEPVEVCPPSIM